MCIASINVALWMTMLDIQIKFFFFDDQFNKLIERNEYSKFRKFYAINLTSFTFFWKIVNEESWIFCIDKNVIIK